MLRTKLGTMRKLAEVLRSRTLVLMYLVIARWSFHLPSFSNVWDGTCCLDLSVVQPARALCGRIRGGMADPSGRTWTYMKLSHFAYKARLSAIFARCGKRMAWGGACCRSAASRYHDKILPTEMYVGPRVLGTL